MSYTDLKGKKFNRLTVLCRDGKDRWGASMWKCKCDCGKIHRARARSLNSGEVKSCGCLYREGPTWSKTHGLTGTSTHRIYSSMKSRCLNPKSQGWKRYGGRGIKVCVGLCKGGVLALIKCIGENPGLTLDRKNNDGHYSCGRCEECKKNGWPLNIRWATRREQSRNTRKNRIVEINGVKKCAIEWAEFAGISPITFAARLRYGFSGSQLIAPVQKMKDRIKNITCNRSR